MAEGLLSSRAILLDIEGTTTPISFVAEVLFPYAKKHGPEFLRNHQLDPEIRHALSLMRAENAADVTRGAPAIERDSADELEHLIRYFLWLIDVDRKATGLKTIQGRVWEEGFGKGELEGCVFPDVPPALERWQRQGRLVAIYSSGSVLAQQQLFRHTTYGDLTVFLAHYFDTTIGSKKEPASYVEIARRLEIPPGEILFVSDALFELDAAKQANFATALSVRSPGHNLSSTSENVDLIVDSFDHLP